MIIVVSFNELWARGMVSNDGSYTAAYWDAAVVSTVDGGMETIDGAYPLSQDVQWPGVVCPWGGRCTEQKSMSGKGMGFCKDCQAAMVPAVQEDTVEVVVVSFIYHDGSVVHDVDCTANFSSPEIIEEMVDEGIKMVVSSTGGLLYSA